MQRTPGQMPVDSHSTRLRDPDHPDNYRSSRSQKSKGVSLVETAGHGGGAGDMLRREVGPLSALCRVFAENLHRLRISQGRERHLDDDESTRLCTGSARDLMILMDLMTKYTCPDQVKVFVPQKIYWMLFIFIYHCSFCSDSFSCICSFPFGFSEIMDVYIPPHKLACLSMSFAQRLQPRFQRTFWQRWISVWSFMQRYQIIQSCMVVCKVCEIDAVSLLPEGSFASACEGECRTMLYDRKEWALEHCKMSRYCKHVLPEQWGCRGHHKVKMMRRRQLSEGLDSVVMTSFESSTFWRKRFPT